MLPCRTSLRSARRMCISSRSMGQILPPQGQGPFLGPDTEHKAAAVTLRKCSPHPAPAHPLCRAGTEAPACRHLRAAPFGHTAVQLCPAVTQHRAALPLVWTPNANPMGNKTPSPSWLSQHWNRALRSSKAHPLALFVFGNRQQRWVSHVHRLMAKERASPTAAPGKRNEISYLAYEQVHLGATVNSSSSYSFALRPAPI